MIGGHAPPVHTQISSTRIDARVRPDARLRAAVISIVSPATAGAYSRRMPDVDWERPEGRRVAVDAARDGARLAEPPTSLRCAVARQALAVLGPARLLEAAGEWQASDAPALPGVFHALALVRPHVLRAPGAGVLAALTETPPWRPAHTNVGERIDGLDWPLHRDAKIALWAGERGGLERTREVPTTVARWLAGDGVDDDALAGAWRRARARWLAGACQEPDQLRQLLAMLCPGDDPPRDDRTLAAIIAAAARETPYILQVAHDVALAAHSAAGGWTAYDAHRRLPSATARTAAEVLCATEVEVGGAAWRELMICALEMVAASQRDDGALLFEGPHARFIVRPGDALTIGRHGDVRISHDTLARRHARLDYISGVCTVLDTESSCGTTLNSVPITDARPLRPGDVIGLGQITLTIRAV